MPCRQGEAKKIVATAWKKVVRARPLHSYAALAKVVVTVRSGRQVSFSRIPKLPGAILWIR